MLLPSFYVQVFFGRKQNLLKRFNKTLLVRFHTRVCDWFAPYSSFSSNTVFTRSAFRIQFSTDRCFAFCLLVAKTLLFFFLCIASRKSYRPLPPARLSFQRWLCVCGVFVIVHRRRRQRRRTQRRHHNYLCVIWQRSWQRGFTTVTLRRRIVYLIKIEREAFLWFCLFVIVVVILICMKKC